MRIYQFTELGYGPAWEGENDSLRISIPNSRFDPDLGADILNDCFDFWMACDELGFDIMVNEHHSTATCLSISPSMSLSVLARQTKNARLLALGSAIANRPDPVRVAEELAWVDVLSRGRLDCGLVRGAPTEVQPTMSNPVRQIDRFWEAHDLILKCFEHHDGPFNWEGDYYNYRQVNIWPRPYQQPCPPIWITGTTRANADRIAKERHVGVAFFGAPKAKQFVDWICESAANYGWTPDPYKFGYLGIVAVGKTEEEGHRRGKQILEYLRTATIVAEEWRNPPGYQPLETNKAMLAKPPASGAFFSGFMMKTRNGKSVSFADATMEDMADAGIIFSGTPDQVFEQIRDFDDYVGGIGNLCTMMHGGSLPQDDALKNIELFAREVHPRLKEHTAQKIRSGAYTAAA